MGAMLTRRGVAISFSVELLQKFFELRFLLWRKDGANLVPALLAHLVKLRISLVVDVFHFGVALQQNRIELLGLIRCEA